MPQFDLAVFLPQIFWLVICFTGLYVFTVGYAVPRLRKASDERWQFTEGTRIEAVKIHHEVEDLTEAYERELNNARKKASHLVSSRLKEISQKTTDDKNEALTEMKKRFMKGELLLSERKLGTSVESHHLAQILSTEIILKLTRNRVPLKSVQSMVTQSFKKDTGHDV